MIHVHLNQIANRTHKKNVIHRLASLLIQCLAWREHSFLMMNAGIEHKPTHKIIITVLCDG